MTENASLSARLHGFVMRLFRRQNAIEANAKRLAEFGRRAARAKLEQVVQYRLGGVGAMRPEQFEAVLQEIATCTWRVVDDEFRAEVTEILRAIPCPLD